MKVNSISNHTHLHKSDCCKPKPKNVSFGFGEDYGPDANEQEYNRNAKNPSTLKSLWYMIEIPAVHIYEALEELIADQKETRKYKARLRETGRLEADPPEDNTTAKDGDSNSIYVEI